MKKVIYLAGAALVMLASASCEKKETGKQSVEKTAMVFTAISEEGGLKTTIKDDGTTAVWSETDKLKVFTAEDTNGSECAIKSGIGESTAEFEGQCAKNGPWTAICPSSSATSFTGGAINFTMQATQTYAAKTFAAGAMPCVAYSATNTFNFKHSFGILQLNLKLESDQTGSVKSITVTDKGGAKLNGTFTVTPSSSAVATKSGTDGTASITLDCGAGVALSTSTATEFWIVVPAGAFASGFDIKVTSTENIEVELSTAKDNTITAGKIKEMPEQVIGLKKTTKGKAYATEVDKDVNWVQLWPDGPKWAEFNVGATSVGDYGGYYAWGSIYKNGNGLPYNGDYNTDDYDLFGDTDTATRLWGKNWQMPSKADLEDLVKSSFCNVSWVTNYQGTDKNGVLFTGKGDYSGNSVFFPATGVCENTDSGNGKVSADGVRAEYFSSTHKEGGSLAYSMGFNSEGEGYIDVGECSRHCRSVRAILNE